MESYRRTSARATPVAAVPPFHPDEPPEIGVFADLASARRAGDHSRLRELIAAMLSHGWCVFAVEPRKAGRGVR